MSQRPPHRLPYRLRQIAEPVQVADELPHPQPLDPPFYTPGQQAYFVLRCTPEFFTKVVSAADVGSDLIYPGESNDIMMVVNDPRDRGDALEMLLADVAAQGNCVNLPPYSTFITWGPHSPYTDPFAVPAGYLLTPWRVATALDSAALLVPVGSVITDLSRIPPGSFPIPAPASGFPFFEVSVPAGVEQVELHLVAPVAGGYASIVTDGNGLNPEFVDLTQDITSIPPETQDVIIIEREFTDGNAHTILITLLPGVQDSALPVIFGGGLLKVVFCGDASEGLGPVSLIRQNGCTIEQSLDDGVTWTPVASFVKSFDPACSVFVDAGANLRHSQENFRFDASGRARALSWAAASATGTGNQSQLLRTALIGFGPFSTPTNVGTVFDLDWKGFGVIDAYQGEVEASVHNQDGKSQFLRAQRRVDGTTRLSFFGANPVEKPSLPDGIKLTPALLNLVNDLQALGLIDVGVFELVGDSDEEFDRYQWRCIHTGYPDFRVLLQTRTDDDPVDAWENRVDITDCIESYLTARDNGFQAPALAWSYGTTGDQMNALIEGALVATGYDAESDGGDYQIFAGQPGFSPCGVGAAFVHDFGSVRTVTGFNLHVTNLDSAPNTIDYSVALCEGLNGSPSGGVDETGTHTIAASASEVISVNLSAPVSAQYLKRVLIETGDLSPQPFRITQIEVLT